MVDTCILLVIVDYTEYAACFQEMDMYNVYNYHCRNIATDIVQLQPGYDYCKSVMLC